MSLNLYFCSEFCLGPVHSGSFTLGVMSLLFSPSSGQEAETDVCELCLVDEASDIWPCGSPLGPLPPMKELQRGTDWVGATPRGQWCAILHFDCPAGDRPPPRAPGVYHTKCALTHQAPVTIHFSGRKQRHRPWLQVMNSSDLLSMPQMLWIYILYFIIKTVSVSSRPGLCRHSAVFSELQTFCNPLEPLYHLNHGCLANSNQSLPSEVLFLWHHQDPLLCPDTGESFIQPEIFGLLPLVIYLLPASNHKSLLSFILVSLFLIERSNALSLYSSLDCADRLFFFHAWTSFLTSFTINNKVSIITH